MDIIASFGLKGGIGKTTSVINYAAAFSFLGKNTLIIDVDDNAAINKILSPQDQVIKTELFITDLLLDSQLSPKPFIKTHTGSTSTKKYPQKTISFDYIPASRTENEIFDQKLIANRLDFKKEFLFKNLIQKIQEIKPYDIIIFDVSPVASTLTRLALLLCDGVIINSRLSKHETKYSIDETIECLNDFSESINRRIAILGIQFNAIRKNVPTEMERFTQAKFLYESPIFLPVPVSILLSELEEKTIFEISSATELIDIYIENSKHILNILKTRKY